MGRTRQQEQKDEVNGLIVDGFEVDGVTETDDDPERRRDVFEPRMRERHAIADAGRAKLLALHNRRRDFLSVQTEFGRCLSRELLQKSRLIVSADIKRDIGR